MEWAQTAEGQQDGKRSGCVMLRELPSRPTQRVCKLSTDLQLSSEGKQHLQQPVLQASSVACWRHDLIVLDVALCRS